MKRTKTRDSFSGKPTAILTSDWHLREDQPVCRTDCFWGEQWKKVQFIRKLQEEYQCPVIHAGDLFNHWKPSPYLLSLTILSLPKDFFTIYGNHDLPQHNLELANKCGINTLSAAKTLQIPDGCHWNGDPNKGSFIHYHLFERSVLVWHVMTYQTKPWPGCTDPMAAKLLRKYPQYDLIVTGHNHKPFVEEHEGRLLVNPGSLTRQEADQIDFKPRVYLWYEKENKVKSVYLPIEQGVITREHIEKIEERDGRIEAFISRLDEDWEAEMNFEENLERFAKTNKIRSKVMDIVYKAID